MVLQVLGRGEGTIRETMTSRKGHRVEGNSAFFRRGREISKRVLMRASESKFPRRRVPVLRRSAVVHWNRAVPPKLLCVCQRERSYFAYGDDPNKYGQHLQ